MSDQNSTLQIRSFARQKLADHLAIPTDTVLLIDSELEHSGKKYDIKSSNPVFTQKEKKAQVWDFDLRGNVWKDGRTRKLRMHSPTCDFYLLIGMRESVPEKVFLLPSKNVPSSHVRISIAGASKYYEYAI